MQFSDALEIAIGLSFIFLLLSLVMTALKEAVESLTRQRGAHLLNGFVELVADPARREAAMDMVRALYGHPLIHGLYRGDFDAAIKQRQLPSYVPARNFALAVIDQVLAAKMDPAPVGPEPAAGAADARTKPSLPVAASQVERLRLAAERIQSAPLRVAILQAIEMAGDDMTRVQKHLESWFDSGMDRVSGWYRRKTHHFMFWAGLAIALGLNVNALTIADGLSQNATLRRAVAAGAERYVAEHPTLTSQGLNAAQRKAAPMPAEAPDATTPPAAPMPADVAATASDAAAPDAPSTAAPATAPATRSEGRDMSAEAVGLIQGLGVPIGWGKSGRDPYISAYNAIWGPAAKPDEHLGGALLASVGTLVTIVAGWFMTALAVTLGAPFWFDLLNKLIVIRATVKPHEKSREEGSQDARDKSKLQVEVTTATSGPAPAALIGPAFDDHDTVVGQLDPADRPREGDEYHLAA